MHTAVVPKPLFQHAMPHIVVVEDKNTRAQTRHVWTWRLNCREPDEVNVDRNERDDKDERVKPPLHCEVCRLAEYLRKGIAARKIDVTTPLFKFEGDDPKENIVIHAGGFCGLLNDKTLSDEEMALVRAKRINLREAFKENAMVKLCYVFAVVNDAKPSEGIKVSVETQLLGDKVKAVIHDQRVSKGLDLGDPFKNPYAIQWEYRDNEREIQKKYAARPVERLKLTPAIEKLIRGPKPDMRKTFEFEDPATVRATLERHCLIAKKIDWDWVFNLKAREESEESALQEEQQHVPEVGDGPEGDAADEREDEGMVACDKCEAPMPETATECPGCGAKYDAAGNLLPDPPPRSLAPAPRKRSEAKKAATIAKPPIPASPPPQEEASMQDDEIPW